MKEISVVVAIGSLFFVACRKEQPQPAVPDPVDAVIGSYYGSVHKIVEEITTPRTSPGSYKYVDTTYQTTVVIKKVAPDSFLVVTDIPMCLFTLSPTLFNLSAVYKREWSELSFNDDSSLTLRVDHGHGYTSGASGFYSYSLMCDFTGKR